MAWDTFLQLSGGLLLLVVGAETLIKASVKIGKVMRVSSLVIGMTVVAFGTSAPEVAVSASAILSNQHDVAFGNTIGSNIFNILFILGFAAILRSLSVRARMIWMDTLVMIAVAVIFYLCALDGKIGFVDGATFLLGLVIYTIITIKMSQKENMAVQEEYRQEFGAERGTHKGAWFVGAQILAVLIGLGLLVWGSKWFVAGSISIARSLGVSDLVISLTIVAAGTSLPEVATSVMAAIKGEQDIAVGNVVGSGIFNILGIGGLCGVLSGHGAIVAPSLLQFDIPIMIAVSVACLPIFFSGHKITRGEGIVLFIYYILYTTYLLMRSAEHDALPVFSATLGYFVIPLTAFTLMFIAFQQYERVRKI